MGVTFSVISGSKRDMREHFLGISEEKVADLVKVFLEHCIAPVLEQSDLSFMVRNAIDIPADEEDFIESLWQTFQAENQLVRTYEMLSALILICHCPWNRRSELLFEVFKCTGSDDVYQSDLSLAVTSVVVGVCRIWREKPDLGSLNKLAEGVASNAYMKLGKEIEESVNKEEFLKWILSRFQESLTVIDYVSMMKALEAPNVSGDINSSGSCCSANVDVSVDIDVGIDSAEREENRYDKNTSEIIDDGVGSLDVLRATDSDKLLGSVVNGEVDHTDFPVGQRNDSNDDVNIGAISGEGGEIEVVKVEDDEMSSNYAAKEIDDLT